LFRILLFFLVPEMSSFTTMVSATTVV
jgi:hypothetical protein